MVLRKLLLDEVDIIRTIDRSEHITHQYYVAEKEIKLREVNIPVIGFNPTVLDKLVEKQRGIIQSGGVVFGAFNNNCLLGAVSIDQHLFGESNQFVKMEILYISASERGKGIGKALVLKAKEGAAGFGASFLYISATPTKSTVDFYLNLGAEVVYTPDKKLYKLEPEDIHLSLSV